MSLGGKLVKFGVGSLIGAGIGAAVGTLTAPEDGRTLQIRLRQRFRDAKVAGDRAMREKQAELIQRYRAEVSDPDALDEEEPVMSRTDAVVAMGLGLNAPGAIASQQAAVQNLDD
jgi:hypothetical protein